MLFNGHYDERYFLPIRVYVTATCRPVAVLLRPDKTLSGIEVRGHLRRLVRQLRQQWPQTRIMLHGDGHYGHPDVIGFCEAAGIDYAFGLPTNATLRGLIEAAANNVRVRRTKDDALVLRRYAETRYGARSWSQLRRLAARIEANTLGLDIHFVVTSFGQGNAEWVYDSLYCTRGQAENLIKLHKTQFASDRTSCRSPLANQVRLVLHTATYWLMLGLRERIPNRIHWPAPSSPPCGATCSRSPGGLSKLPAAFAPPSLPPARRRRCSAASPAASIQRGHSQGADARPRPQHPTPHYQADQRHHRRMDAPATSQISPTAPA